MRIRLSVHRVRRDAFTLVEILVVIAIIGILVSLSLPAISAAKERMNRAKCADQLRQIAMATINHQTSHDTLPGYVQQFGEFAGGMDPADPGSYGGNVPRHLKIGGWQVAILDDLDRQPLYERWNLDRYPLLSDGGGERPATAEGYSTIAASNVEFYQCPSASGTMARHGINHYVANTGMHVDSFPFTYTRPTDGTRTVDFERSMSKANGALNNRYAGFDPGNPTSLVPTGKRIRTDDFRDGATSTMLYSENHQAQPWHLTRLTGNTAHLTAISTVGGKEVTVYPVESRYLQGSVWHFEDEQLFAGAPAPQPLHKINGGDTYNLLMTAGNMHDVARPSSLPPGGVNMAMADGSVRFVFESIDYRTYQALLTPSGHASDVPMNEYIPSEEI